MGCKYRRVGWSCKFGRKKSVEAAWDEGPVVPRWLSGVEWFPDNYRDVGC